MSVNWGGSATATSDSVQLVSTTSTSSSWKVVGNATYPAGGTFTVSVTVTDVDQSANTFTDTHTTIIVATPESSASFVGQDATTKGSWIGTYGAQGYDAIGYTAALPTYATVTPSSDTSTPGPRAPRTPAPSRSRPTSPEPRRRRLVLRQAPASPSTSTSLTARRTTWSCTSSTGHQAGRASSPDQRRRHGQGAGNRDDLVVQQGRVLALEGHREHGDHDHPSAGPNAVLNGLFFDPPTPPPAPRTATFLERDTRDERGTGSEPTGRRATTSSARRRASPAKATVTPSSDTFYTWTSSYHRHPRLPEPGQARRSRVAAFWYSANPASRSTSTSPTARRTTWSCTSTTGTATGRGEQVQISDATPARCSTPRRSRRSRMACTWTGRSAGTSLITITRPAGPNAVLNGLFLDPTSRRRHRPRGPPSFLEQDAATHAGNWVGTYGAQGYDVIGHGRPPRPKPPSLPSGQSTYTWTTSTSNTSALQDPAAPRQPRRRLWYSSTSFTVNVNLSDGQTHDLELYFLDGTTGPGEKRADQRRNHRHGAGYRDRLLVHRGRLPAVEGQRGHA